MKINWSPADARARAGLRWTPWRLLLLPLCGVCWVGLSMAWVLATLEAVPLFPPKDAFFCTTTRAAPYLLVLVPLSRRLRPASSLATF